MAANRQRAKHGWKFWVAVISAVNALHLWLFFHLENANPVQFWMTIAIHVVGSLGPFWMLAHWFIRRRKRLTWQSWMWLFFVPWGFLWYISEKYESAGSDFLSVGEG